MILSTKGIAHLINEPLVGRVTRNRDRRENDYFLIYEYPEEMTSLDSFQAILTCLPNLDQTKFHGRAIYAVSSLEHLFEDDIVVVHPNGIVKTLFRISSFQNFILFTERCNSNCIMCSQPPKNRDDSDYLFKIHSKFIPLIPKNCSELGITGGEPTLLGNKFFQQMDGALLGII